MNYDLSLFINLVVSALGIKVPVDIRMSTTNPRIMKGVAAHIQERTRKGKVVGLVIFVYLKTSMNAQYALQDVIAHELVHGIMLQHGVHNESHHHDKRFQKICKYLEKVMKDAGFPIGKLYNSKSDID